ncbi:uL15 family ribosomal protein [Nanoarchaeota archaeon]
MRRKKDTRMRGSHTHGGGSKKKRRGAGNRGGRGRAGSGKKGDCKKPMYWKEKPKKGFHSSFKKVVAINVGELDAKASASIGKAAQAEINLTKLGIGKLLGTGTVKNKLIITVDQASESAIAKVKKAGGKVNITALPKPEAKPSEAKAPEQIQPEAKKETESETESKPE